MGTKRLIAAIIIVILLILGLVGGYYYIEVGSQQARFLQEEMKKVIEADLLTEDIDMQIKTFGNYGKVETAIKEYLNDVKKTYTDMQNICNSEQIKQIVSVANIEADEEELTVLSQKVEEKKQELDTLTNKTQNIRVDDNMLKTIEEKGVKENYIDVYQNIMTHEDMQTKLEMAETKIKKEQTEAEERIEALEKIVDFLKTNKKYWEINEGRLQFTNANKLSEYLEVLNEVE